MLLGEIVKQVSGVTYQKAQAVTIPIIGYKPVLRAGNIFASRILEADYVYVPEDLIRNDRLLKYGDILIAASSGSLSVVGKAAMLEADMDAGFGAFCRVLRPKTEVVYPRYLKFFFETNYYKNTIRHLAEGANINNLKSEHFHNLEIPLPPLAEQQKIAAILDAADSLRQKDQQLVERYTALSQSLFLEMFGDLTLLENKPLKKVSKFIDYRGKTPTKTTAGIPLLTAKNIKVGYISNESAEFISVDGYYEWMTRGFPNTGDILFTTEAPMGHAAMLPKFEKVAIAQRLICIQPNMELNSFFLLYVFFSEFFKSQLFRRATGSTVKGIRSKELEKIVIPIPTITLQNQFAERIQLIEAQKQQSQRSLAKSEALFNSLLQQAFTGELTHSGVALAA